MSATVGDAQQFWTAFRYQLRSYLRTWRFVGLLVFVAVISAAVLGVQIAHGTATVTATHPTASDELSSYLGPVSDAVIITAAFLGGDALAVDLSGGPGYLMLTQPVRRHTLLAGRFVAAAVAGLAVAIVYYAFAVGAAEYFYGTVPSAILLSFAAAFLFGLACLAVAFFFSSFFRSPAVSIVASLLILIIGFPILVSIGELTGGEPWYSLNYGSGIITSVLSTSFQHETTTHLAVGGQRGTSITLYGWTPYPWEGAVIMAVYLIAFLVLSFVIYRYKEVRG